jgi:hypothetical protein
MVRQMFYILVSRHGYPLTTAFYKRLDYHLVKLRRSSPTLLMKFIDFTRSFVEPPYAFNKVELWMEKDSIRNFVEELATKYKIAMQVQRGFGSLSMYRDALIRSRERGVECILYIGDFDPSGLLIEEVTGKEMNIVVKRICLTSQQIEKYRPPSRPLNMKDSRAKNYAKRYGNKCWEVEALEPTVLLNIVENALKEYVPPEYIAEVKVREKAASLTRELLDPIFTKIQSEIYDLLLEGVAEQDVLTKVAKVYNLNTRKEVM